MTITISSNGGMIEGNVTNAKDEPAAGALVTLIPDPNNQSVPGISKTADADQNGHFAIRGIRPGEYKIYAWEPEEPGAYDDADFSKLHESGGQTLSIKESAHETVQLTLIPADASATAGPTR